MSLDEMPIVGALKNAKNLFVSTGHYKNGVYLGPIFGELLTDYIVGQSSSDQLHPFSPGRFYVE
jgi:glycine/D-amino acid oxidase-like deaminating enzyme